MSRNMQGGNRSRMGMSDNRGPRNFSSAKLRGHGGPGVLGSGPASLLSQNLGGGFGMGGGMGGRDGGGYEMDSLLQQRSLQQQLSLRESQLALANSLLQQQQQTQLMGDSPRLGVQGMGSLGMGPVGGLGGLGGLGGGPGMMSKRHMEMPSDFQPFMKRPRTDLSLSQPRDRYRNRGNDVGNRGSNIRRNQTSSASSSRPYRSSDRDSSGRGRKDSFTEEKYDPENPTGDDEEKKEGGEGKGKSDKYHCYVCNINCRDDNGFSHHMNSKRHKDCMLSVLSIHEEKSSQIKSQMVSRIKAEKHLRNLEDEEKKRKARGFCKVCDISLEIFYDEHVRTVFHKKRALQVNKGCGWCGIPNFVNFSAVLDHRETEEHKKNQEIHEGPAKDNKGRRYSDSRHERRTETKSQEKKKSPVKVNMPESLAKFNPEVAVGQTCVVTVSGWFCKLCNKFYNNETAAKDTHCKTEPHFGKYKRFIYAKLKAKAEAQQAAAEKAAAEEEEKKKKAEAENKDGDENGTGEKEPKEECMEGEEKEGDCGGDGGAGKEEAAEGEEEEMHDETAMLAVDAEGNLDLMEDDDVENDSRLLNEMENSAYQTAEDEALGEEETGADVMEGEDLSLEEGDSTRQLLDNELQEGLGPDGDD